MLCLVQISSRMLTWIGKKLPGLNHIGPLSSPASSVPDSTGNRTLDYRQLTIQRIISESTWMLHGHTCRIK